MQSKRKDSVHRIFNEDKDEQQGKIILPNTGDGGEVLQLHHERWEAEHHGS